MAYLSGLSLSTGSTAKNNKQRFSLLANGLLFTVGFVVVFVLLGISAHKLGAFLTSNKVFIQQLGGLLFVVLGTFMLGITKPLFLNTERKLHIVLKNPKLHYLNSLLFGFTFGFAWTPCIGPVLAVILFWASQASTLAMGAGLLFVYGLGLGLPFVLIALLFDKFSHKLSMLSSFGRKLQIIAAVIIIFMGLLLITGKVEVVSLGCFAFVAS